MPRLHRLTGYFDNQIHYISYSPLHFFLAVLLCSLTLHVSPRNSYYRLIKRIRNSKAKAEYNTLTSSIAFAFTKNQKAACSIALDENKAIDFVFIYSIFSTRLTKKQSFLSIAFNIFDSFNVICDHARQSPKPTWKKWQWSIKESLFFSIVLHSLIPFKRVCIFSDQQYFFHLLRSFLRDKTFSVFQHAPLGTTPPPPSFDFYFLFSKDSLAKYSSTYPAKTFPYIITGDFVAQKICSEVKTNLGSAYHNFQLRSNSILICTNLHDNFDKTIELAQFLSSSGEFSVIVRPHPADKRFFELKANTSSFIISNHHSLSWALSTSSIVVANESSVLLYAMAASCLAYKYRSISNTLEHGDIYGFIKNKLILLEYDEKKTLLTDISLRKCTYNASMLSFYLGFDT